MSKRIARGTVISTKMAKTAVVEIQTTKIHTRYGKRHIQKKKFKADIQDVKVQDGDKVLIEECAPISKTKTWIVKSVEKKDK